MNWKNVKEYMVMLIHPIQKTLSYLGERLKALQDRLQIQDIGI